MLHRRYIALSIACASLALAFFAFAPRASAGTNHNIHGSAWSDNIGWISFNCTDGGDGGSDICGTSDYGVTKHPTTNEVSGYAWSDNIGWISFNQAGGCPVSGCVTKAVITVDAATGGTMTGWARACGVFASGCSGQLKAETLRGAWDGWIFFDAVPLGAKGDDGYPFGGHAWGSEVIGWIDMAGVYLADDMPYVELTADPEIVSPNGDSTLSWKTANTDTCTANWTWDDSKREEGSFKVVGIAQDTVYTLKCYGQGKTVEASVTVKVISLNLSTNTFCVASGNQPVLKWTPKYANVCTASGAWSGSKDASEGTHTQSVPGITSTKAYSLQCKNTTVTPVAETPVRTQEISICSSNFQIQANRSSVELVKASDGSAVTKIRVNVRVIAQNGFSNSVKFEASPSDLGQQPATYAFFDAETQGVEDTIAGSSEYSRGVFLEVTLPKLPEKGTYPVTITATDLNEDGGAAATAKNVIINLLSEKKRPSPFYIEF